LHAAGKRQDGTWKLQFKKVEVVEDGVGTLQRPEFVSRSGRVSHDGKDIGFGTGFGKEGKKGRHGTDGDDSNEDSMISDSMIRVGNEKLTAS